MHCDWNGALGDLESHFLHCVNGPPAPSAPHISENEHSPNMDSPYHEQSTFPYPVKSPPPPNPYLPVDLDAFDDDSFPPASELFAYLPTIQKSTTNRKPTSTTITSTLPSLGPQFTNYNNDNDKDNNNNNNINNNNINKRKGKGKEVIEVDYKNNNNNNQVAQDEWPGEGKILWK